MRNWRAGAPEGQAVASDDRRCAVRARQPGAPRRRGAREEHGRRRGHPVPGAAPLLPQGSAEVRAPASRRRRLRRGHAVPAARRRGRSLRRPRFRRGVCALRHSAAVLARCAGRPARPGRDGLFVHAHHQAGVPRTARRCAGGRAVRTAAVRVPPHDREGRGCRPRACGAHILRVFDERTDRRVQGHARIDADAPVLPRPRRRFDRDGGGARAFALFHEHDPVVGARASQPLHRAQRRDQHAALQRELDAGARGEPVLAGHGRRPGKRASHPERRGVRFGHARQRARVHNHERAQPAARGVDGACPSRGTTTTTCPTSGARGMPTSRCSPRHGTARPPSRFPMGA